MRLAVRAFQIGKDDLRGMNFLKRACNTAGELRDGRID
jgi:hypothetical protein